MPRGRTRRRPCSKPTAVGWRAEAVALAQGIALVEGRRPAVRGTPLVAVLRRPGEAEAWLRAHGRGHTYRAQNGRP